MAGHLPIRIPTWSYRHDRHRARARLRHDRVHPRRGNEIPSRAWWEDEGEVLVLEVEVGPDQEIILTDRMSLTDENTLVLERTLEIPGMDEEIEQTITYRRR